MIKKSFALHLILLLITGFRHIRLRNSKNQPLEISTLFIYSRLEDDVSHDLMTFTGNSMKKENSAMTDSKQSGVLSTYLSDTTRYEKEVGITANSLETWIGVLVLFVLHLYHELCSLLCVTCLLMWCYFSIHPLPQAICVSRIFNSFLL